MRTAAAPQPARPAEHRIRGILLRCGAMMSFAIMAGAIKLGAERGVSTIELIFYRNALAIPVVIGWVLLGPGLASLMTKRPGAHASRAAIGLVSMVFNFQAITMLPLAEATTIGFAAPLFATLLSALVLSEKVGPRRWIAVLLGFLGVLIVMQPGSTQLPLDGVAVALLGALGVATVVITLRRIGATESATATVFWFTVASSLVTLVPALIIGHWPTRDLWPILLVMGVAGGGMQIMMTASLRYAPIAVLAPFDYFQLLWAVLIGWLLWSAMPAPATLAGGSLIVASGLYTAWREHRRHRAITAIPPTA
jgi:drug/metabolite transporter (DMT)-like permease